MRNGRAKHFGVGLLYSRLSLSACVEAARKSNAIYTFNGATGIVRWLKGEYAYLAPNGAASLLRRLGIKFNWVTDEDLKESKSLERYHTLIVPHAVSLPTQAFRAIEAWVHQGGYLLATGQTDLPAELLGLSELKWYRPNGYTMIRYGESDLIAGYRGYTVGICKPASGSQVLASVYEVMNPQEEVNGQISPLLGSGIIRTKQVVFISLPLFETFGAMLQGHVNFEDMRNWGHRYKYLDWLGRFIKEILEDSDWKHLWHVRIKPWGESRGVVVLRHDVDESSDLTYLDYEKKNQIPATYAILNDRRCQHWLKAVASHPAAEAAYHFDTAPQKTTIIELLLRKPREVTVEDILKITGGRGLWRQSKKARDVLGIPILTGQRHKAFFFYPETIDGMDYLYKQEAEVLGLGTMFRFTNIMFTEEKEEKDSTYVVQHPDTSVPFWFPFKLWYASTNDHHALRGWDITHLVEPEPWLTEHLLNQEAYLEEGVYTLGFHPAHCHGKAFRQEGNWDWFKYAVELGRSRGYLFTTCKEVFERLNQWESLDFELSQSEGWVENHHSPSPITVYLEHPHGKLFFKEKETYAELVNSNLTKVVLANGDSIHFSVG
jgi:hypothetical protein